MALDDSALDILFRSARTKWEWTDQPVTEADLRALYDLLKFGPTSANSSPARFVFVCTPEGKEKLKPALSAGNIDKTMAAPVTVIVAQDPLFYQHLPKLFPPADAKSWFSGNPDLAEETAFRNSISSPQDFPEWLHIQRTSSDIWYGIFPRHHPFSSSPCSYCPEQPRRVCCHQGKQRRSARIPRYVFADPTVFDCSFHGRGHRGRLDEALHGLSH